MAIIEAGAIRGNAKLRQAMDGLTRILKGGIEEDEIVRLGIRRREIMAGAEEGLQETKRQLELAGITFGDQGAATVAQERQRGLSVAIRQITTRQADELAFVLRTTQGLSQQIANNTNRTASALEEWLPFISERIEAIEARPAMAGGGPAALENDINAERRAAAGGIAGFNFGGLPAPAFP